MIASSNTTNAHKKGQEKHSMYTFNFHVYKDYWRSSLSGLAVVMVFVVAGCGGSKSTVDLPRHAVTGKVLLADGKPLTSGRIIFLSDSPPGSFAADIGRDGTFDAKGTSGDGMPEAKYRVRISPGGAAKSTVKPAFASKYLDDENSGLTATVTSEASKNQFEFKLEATDAAGSSSRDRRR
jgi:hypothetical protein